MHKAELYLTVLLRPPAMPELTSLDRHSHSSLANAPVGPGYVLIDRNIARSQPFVGLPGPAVLFTL
jgi:hypothetical protein